MAILLKVDLLVNANKTSSYKHMFVPYQLFRRVVQAPTGKEVMQASMIHFRCRERERERRGDDIHVLAAGNCAPLCRTIFMLYEKRRVYCAYERKVFFTYVCAGEVDHRENNKSNGSLTEIYCTKSECVRPTTCTVLY